MSLLNLVHKSVVIKFAESAGTQFKTEANYAFHLAGVDAMGFLLIQDLKPGSHVDHEIASDAYWINKDLVREIHHLDMAKFKEPLVYAHQNSGSAKAAASAEPARRAAAPKAEKPKPLAKTKPALT